VGASTKVNLVAGKWKAFRLGMERFNDTKFELWKLKVEDLLVD